MYISIIEDEKILGEKIKKKLEKNGYFVNLYTTMEDFVKSSVSDAGLFIVDISLGLRNEKGFEIIKWLREVQNLNTPIIITSGFNDDEKKIYGLNIGADDYLPKPFSPDELLARIRAVIRREHQNTNTAVLKYKNIRLNQESREVFVEKESVYLTGKELQLLEFFILNPNKMVSREILSDSVWGHKEATENTINATISKVRRKIGPSFGLTTKINEGYILKK